MSKTKFRDLPRHYRSKFGRRAFSVAGRANWNFLPAHLRDPSLSSYSFIISNFPPSAAELFRLPPHRSGTHYQKQSFRHQHCGRSCTNWKRSYLNYHCISGLAVTFVTLVTLILFWLIDWLIPRLYIPATVWEHLLGRDIVDNDDRTITLWYGCTMNIF